MGRITSNSIRTVREANDIVEVISAVLKLERAGSSLKALCPFHNEKTPSFHVSAQRQTFKCFGCGEGGSVVDFIMSYEKLDFVEAIERLAERAGVKLEYESGGAPVVTPQQRSRKQRQFDVADWGAHWFHKKLLKDPAAEHAREYLKSRGFSDARAKRWMVGYAPDSFDAIMIDGMQTHKDPTLLDDVGLTRVGESGKRFDFFRDRVMFPIRDVQGRVVAYGGRKLNNEAPGGKYINSPTTAIYDKSRVLYGIDKLPASQLNRERKRGQKLVVVVEGYMDVIACHEAGIDCAVAPCGTSITVEQLTLLRRFADKIVLLMDGDAAGQASMERIVPEVVEQGLFVTAVTLPGGQDPDDFLKDHKPEELIALLEGGIDLFRFKLDAVRRRFDMSHPAGARDAFNDALASLAGCDDELLLDRYLRELASAFRMHEQDVRRRFVDSNRRISRRGMTTQAQSHAVVALPIAERTLLLRLLTHPELIRPVGELVDPADLASEHARAIYVAILNCFDEEGNASGSNLLDYLDGDDEVTRRVLVDLLEGELSVAHFQQSQSEQPSDEVAFNLDATLAGIRDWVGRRRARLPGAGLESATVSPQDRLAALRVKKARR